MRYNLIPLDMRKTDKAYLSVPEKLLFTVTCVSVSAAAAIAGIIFYAWAEQEKEQYALQSYPIQQQIIRQNELEQRLHNMEEQMRNNDKQRIHWGQVLVCLADSKPDQVIVKTLSIRKNTVMITGQVAAVGAERKWQEFLRRQACIKSVVVSMENIGKKGKEQQLPSFKMEVEVFYAGNMETD